jgi:hypothetical protein
LLKAELAEDCTGHAVTEGGRQRQSVARAHREPQVPDCVGGGEVKFTNHVDGRKPVTNHSLNDVASAFCCDTSLVRRHGELLLCTLTVVGAVDGDSSDPRGSSKPERYVQNALAALVAAAAVTEEDQPRW